MMKNALLVVFVAVLYSYYTPFFHNLHPVSYRVSLPHKLTGGLKVNEDLENAELLHKDVIHWPESFAVYKDNIYTGLGDGRIVQITDNEVIDICRIGSDCKGQQHKEHICGRPLGLKFDKNGLLYVVDAYHGLFEVNVQTGEKKNILASTTIVDSLPLFFLNDLVISDAENAIYLTQSSTRWNISEVVISIVEHDTSGRLLKLELDTKKVSVLVRGISFPNGVELSHDGKSLLIAEGNEHKIIRYYLDKQKEMDELPIILPGEPDNISRNPRGNYWVGLSNARTIQNPTIYDRVSEYPNLRRWFLHLHHLVCTPISLILNLVPSPTVRKIGFELLNGRIAADVFPTHGIIIEFNDKGIVRSLQSPTGKIAHISEVLEHKGYLYLGSWRNRFIGKVKI